MANMSLTLFVTKISEFTVKQMSHFAENTCIRFAPKHTPTCSISRINSFYVKYEADGPVMRFPRVSELC